MIAFERLRHHKAEGPDPITQEAARWLDKRVAGPLPLKDEAAFEAWRSNPVHAEAYARLERTLQNVRSVGEDIGLARLRAEAKARATTQTRRSWLPPAAAAVVLLTVGVLAGSLGWLTPDQDGQPSAPAQTAAAGESLRDYSAVETATGERITVTLDDGSEVTLNTRTRLAVHYTPAERVIELQGGQAVFNVAHDPDRPFIVDLGAQRVRAIGTEFDIRLRPDGVVVTLLEGLAVVEEYSEPQSDAAAREIRHVAELTPGEQFISDPVEARPEIRTADIERVTSWRRGRMIFRNTTLAEAVEEANRYAHTPIELADERMAQLRISGAFPTDRVDAFVEALTSYFPLEEVGDTPEGDADARRLVWSENSAE